MASAAFENIVEDFEFLEDWEDRYRFVIDLGKAMTPLDDSQRIPATKVEGCASQVWLVPTIRGQGATSVFSMAGDSDAMIVRGLIAVLAALYNGLTSAEVVRTDALGEMARLGLDQHLSAQRSNGLRAMVERVKILAGAAVES